MLRVPACVIYSSIVEAKHVDIEETVHGTFYGCSPTSCARFKARSSQGLREGGVKESHAWQGKTTQHELS